MGSASKRGEEKKLVDIGIEEKDLLTALKKTLKSESEKYNKLSFDSKLENFFKTYVDTKNKYYRRS